MTDGPQQSWELQYEKTWLAIEEKDGSIRDSVLKAMLDQKRQFRLPDQSIKRGIMRHVYLVVDASESTKDMDYSPMRLDFLMEAVKAFSFEFFDQNPLAQMGVLVCMDGKCQIISELLGNPLDIVAAIQKTPLEPSGDLSLENGIRLAKGLLKTVTSRGSKEVLFLLSSLSTVDPGDIFESIDECREKQVKLSAIHMACELQVVRSMTKATNGQCQVTLDGPHFKQVLMEHVLPPPLMTNDTSLLKMGFPRRVADTSVCVCHGHMTIGGFICPRCFTKSCHLPSACVVCDLSLVSSAHLARSFHFIFPLKRFEPSGHGICNACEIEDNLFACANCKRAYCSQCDVFMHDILHNCPGCLQK